MRLFLKIFLVFWLSNAAVFAGAFALYALWDNDRWQLDEARLATLGQQAAAAWERGGRGELRRALRQLRAGEHLSARLLNEEGESLGLPLSVELRDLISTSDDDHIRPWDNPHGHFGIDLAEIQTAGGEYRFITFRDKPWKRHGERARGPFGLWLLAIAVACGVIAWLFIRPLRQLQGTTRQLAEGNLGARVPVKISRRRDALGDLGREFDRTADRVQSLLDSQRRLLRDVSHELRSPLARIQVALALAENRSSGGEAELARINSELARLDALIGQVLTLTRLESGVDALDRGEFDLRQLLQQVAADAEYEGAAREVRVRVAVDEALPLCADADKLHSALENVVRNAVRYTTAGSEVLISRAQAAPADQLCLQVRDHGPGVPEADLPNLFDAFYRSGEARDVASGGHGVGLAIARSVLHAHGGEISAANHPEGGLLITLCLPLSVG